VTMASPLPPIWFERPIPSEFAEEVAASCAVLGPASTDDPYAGLATAIAVIAGAWRYDAAFMDRAPHLRVIARTGIGVDNVDVAAATGRWIAVCNTPDGPTISTAEHAVTLMLLVAKNVESARAALLAGEAGTYFASHRGIELAGKVLGLVGFGRIGRHLATIARGIGMEVRFFDPFVDATDVLAGIVQVEALDDLLGGADIVSVHVPLSEATRGMFGRGQFAAMKPGAVFVNTARGGLVDQEALLGALDSGRLFGVGLDVTTPEPLPPDHPLLARPGVVVTPHIASATAEGKARMFRIAFQQAIAVIEARRPEHLVNPEVWERSNAATEAGVGR
jgi:D-3-phosphoglycerate dehydrogenase / 2-oxoglutarate reductase